MDIWALTIMTSASWYVGHSCRCMSVELWHGCSPTTCRRTAFHMCKCLGPQCSEPTSLLQNAYNLGVAITPIGSSCQADTCSSIPDLQSFCQSPNVYADGYCINTAGPGLVSTASTQQFKSACPAAYSYSKDDSTSTVTCPTGVNYQVAFCP